MQILRTPDESDVSSTLPGGAGSVNFGSCAANALEPTIIGTAQAANEWHLIAPQRRAIIFSKLADTLRQKCNTVAEAISQEMGKPIREAQAEVSKSAHLADYCANLACAPLEPKTREIKEAGLLAETRRHPLGVILCVSPANYPIWQPLRSILPALWSGNGVLLRHASAVPRCASLLEDIFQRSGFPAKLVSLVPLARGEIAAMLANPKIQGLAYTGGDAAGRLLAAECGKRMKPATCMLSGNDPFLVFPDADLPQAVELCAASRLQNAGQACIAAQRVLLHRSIADEFSRRLKDHLATWEIGSPLDPATRLGPLISQRHAHRVSAQVKSALAAGGNLVYQGETWNGSETFFPITVIADNRPGKPLWDEEVFGPVFGLSVFEDEPAMIAAANDSRYPLGATVCSRRLKLCREIAATHLRAPIVAINSLLQSHPGAPFNPGCENGLGTELGDEGFTTFTRSHTTYSPCSD